MIVSALTSTSEFPSPMIESAISAERTDGDEPHDDERDAVEADADPEDRSEAAAGGGDERHEAADQPSDPECGVEVADAGVAHVEQLERRTRRRGR